MEQQNKKLWFKNKRYGYGWVPVAWQGWLALALYVAVLVAVFLNVDKGSHSNSDTLIGFAFRFIGISILFIALCYAKGETPRWQWGEKKRG